MSSNLIQAIITFQNFQFLGVECLKVFDLVIIQIFIFDDFSEVAV